MDAQKITHFKEKLLEEKARLEEELSSIARRNPTNPGDWDAVTDETENDPSDKNDLADSFEDLAENTGIADTLEVRLRDVNDALAKIDAGTYGADEKTGEPIPEDRLEANPAARTDI